MKLTTNTGIVALFQQNKLVYCSLVPAGKIPSPERAMKQQCLEGLHTFLLPPPSPPLPLSYSIDFNVVIIMFISVMATTSVWAPTGVG